MESKRELPWNETRISGKPKNPGNEPGNDPKTEETATRSPSIFCFSTWKSVNIWGQRSAAQNDMCRVEWRRPERVNKQGDALFQTSHHCPRGQEAKVLKFAWLFDILFSYLCPKMIKLTHSKLDRSRRYGYDPAYLSLITYLRREL